MLGHVAQTLAEIRVEDSDSVVRRQTHLPDQQVLHLHERHRPDAPTTPAARREQDAGRWTLERKTNALCLPLGGQGPL